VTLPPEPRANPSLVGHDAAAAAFAAGAATGRLHHAWLLAGPVGVGKSTFAYRAARWLLAGQPAPVPGEALLFVPPQHPAFRRVAASSHPDLFTLEPNTGERGSKEILRVEDARDAIRFLSFTAAEGGWRAIVLDGVERADTVAFSNILLKTLEEPPPRTVILAVTAQPDRLLPTIRSRCRRLDFAPLPEAELLGLLAAWLPEEPAPKRASLAAIADGAPGRALTLAAGEGVALAALAAEVLAAARPDPRRALMIAEKVADRRDPTALGTFFGLLRRGMAAGLAASARGSAVAPAWLGGRPLADGAALWARLGTLAADTERLNLDRRAAVITGLGWLGGDEPVWD